MKGEVTDTNRKIVNEIASKRILHDIIYRITKDGTIAHDMDSLCDLEQDIYISLLEDTKLETVYNEGHINYYLARIVSNNLISSSSRYYMQYLRPILLNAGWNDNINKLDDWNN